MILFLNTTQREQSTLALVNSDRVFKRTFKTPARLSEKLPVEIKKFLQKHKVKLQDITKIAVVHGPGSFMASRTGVAYANALASSLNIPAVGITEREIPEDLLKLKGLKYKKAVISPKYAAPPNITKPKVKR